MHMSWSETLAEEMSRYFQEPGLKKALFAPCLSELSSMLSPQHHSYKCCLARECTNK